MKQFKSYILFCILLLSGIQVSAQCEPDASCTDSDKTGAFCPATLPDAILDVSYETVLTMIPPSEYEFEGIRLDIAYIEIDSVLNFPPGITYTAYSEKFYADTKYCVLLDGTATEAGVFTLDLYITPYVKHPLIGILKGPQVIDNTSLVLNVNDVTSTDLSKIKEFQVLQNMPNPFSQSTRIGFYTPVIDNIEIKIYNIFGELIHQEPSLVVPGEHFFNLDGSDLFAGPYLYIVKSSSSYLTRKLIKTR